MEQVIFERFVDNSIPVKENEDEFEFELELEGGEGEGKRRRYSSYRRGSRRDDSLTESFSEDGGVGTDCSGITIPIPRRYTLDTASSLPSHLPRRQRQSQTESCVSGSCEGSLSREPSLQRPIPSCQYLSVPTTPSLTSLRSLTSSPNPKTKYLPRILRRSLSRLLPGRTKSPSPPERVSLSASPSHVSFISPDTKEIVRESIKKGLPIIPFASQEIWIQSEEDKLRIKKASKKESEGDDRIEDAVDQSEYCPMEPNQEIKQKKPKKSLISQSSYVEMNPAEEDVTSSTWDNDPYMKMSKIYPSSVGKTSFFENDPYNIDTKKNSSILNFAEKRLHLKPQKNESLGRHYKKGNKHRDDYVFLDFETNKDCVDMNRPQHRVMSI